MRKPCRSGSSAGNTRSHSRQAASARTAAEFSPSVTGTLTSSMTRSSQYVRRRATTAFCVGWKKTSSAVRSCVGREPVAIDGRGLSHDRFGLTGVDVDAEKELGVRHGALRSQPHAASADHHAFAATRIAALGEAVGKGRQQGLQKGRVVRWAVRATGSADFAAGFRDFGQELVPCAKHEGGRRAIDRTEARVGASAGLEFFERDDAVEHVGAGDVVGRRSRTPLVAASAAAGSQKGIPFGKQGGRDRRSRRTAAPVSFDQQACDPRVDREPRHDLANFGQRAFLNRSQTSEHGQCVLDGEGRGGLEPGKGEDVGFAPAPKLQHGSRQIDALDFRLLKAGRWACERSSHSRRQTPGAVRPARPARWSAAAFEMGTSANRSSPTDGSKRS